MIIDNSTIINIKLTETRFSLFPILEEMIIMKIPIEMAIISQYKRIKSIGITP